MSADLVDPAVRALPARKDVAGKTAAKAVAVLDPRPTLAAGAPDPMLAETVLRAVIESGDVIGRGRHGERFMLVALPRRAFRQLCQHGAEDEDREDDGTAEENGDDEPSAVTP